MTEKKSKIFNIYYQVFFTSSFCHYSWKERDQRFVKCSTDKYIYFTICRYIYTVVYLSCQNYNSQYTYENTKWPEKKIWIENSK